MVCMWVFCDFGAMSFVICQLQIIFVMTFLSLNHENLFMKHISGISATFQFAVKIKHHLFLCH